MGEHPGAVVDANDAALGPDGRTQLQDGAAGAAADVEHGLPALQVESLQRQLVYRRHRAFAGMRWNVREQIPQAPAVPQSRGVVRLVACFRCHEDPLVTSLQYDRIVITVVRVMQYARIGTQTSGGTCPSRSIIERGGCRSPRRYAVSPAPTGWTGSACGT